MIAPRGLGLCAGLWAAAALAHGANPQAYDVLPAAGGRAIVNTTIGTFTTADDGQHWDWVCGEALGPGRSPQPIWYQSASGAYFVADYAGLSVTRDGLCTFDRIPTFDASGAADLDGRGATLWTTTGRFNNLNGIFRSTDDGATWDPPVVTAMTEFFNTVRLSKSDPNRIYVSAWWYDPTYSMYLYRSDNGGTSFARTDLTTVLPELGAFYVHAVHPTNPDIVLGSLTVARTPNPAVVVRSTNGGQTWSALFEAIVPVNQAVFSDDGSKAWVAAGNVLYESTDQGATFVELAEPRRDTCAAPLGSALYVCGNELIDGFVAGRRTGSAAFTPFMNWGQVVGPKSCSATSTVTTVCAPNWPTVRAQIELLTALPDGGDGGGGGSDGAGGGGGGTAPKPCGCSSAPSVAVWAALALLLRKRTKALVHSRPP